MSTNFEKMAAAKAARRAALATATAPVVTTGEKQHVLLSDVLPLPATCTPYTFGALVQHAGGVNVRTSKSFAPYTVAVFWTGTAETTRALADVTQRADGKLVCNLTPFSKTVSLDAVKLAVNSGLLK
jgi:hypothetical protein